MFYLLAEFGDSLQLICVIGIAAVAMGFIMRKLRQPNLIAYILLGIIIGPYNLNMVSDPSTMKFIGELGIILLFFFIGMEINLQDFFKHWKLAVFGTLAQFLASIGIIFLIGYFMSWPLNRILVIGCVIALSSSAVIFKLIEEKGLTNTTIGKNVMNILLAQDVAIAPILILIAIAGGIGDKPIYLPVIGGMLFILIIIYIYKAEKITWLPFQKEIEENHEHQVFLALFFCFAGALLANIFQISEALGAFVGGLVMHAGKATEWIHDAIHAFRILFVAIFFISIGAQLNLHFVLENWEILSLVLVGVYASNHFLNSLILKIYGVSWKDAIFGGALLGQIGELSFLLCLSALNAGILSRYGYDFTLALISLSLAISPLWIIGTEQIINKSFLVDK